MCAAFTTNVSPAANDRRADARFDVHRVRTRLPLEVDADQRLPGPGAQAVCRHHTIERANDDARRLRIRA